MYFRLLTSIALMGYSCLSFSAATVNLNNLSGLKLISYFNTTHQASGIKETLVPQTTHIDFHQIKHIRLSEQYAGYPVWNASAVVHLPNDKNKKTFSLAQINNATTMNGKIYEGLAKDLANKPLNQLTDNQKNAALSSVKKYYSQKMNISVEKLIQETVQTIIFIDDKNQAQLAFFIHLLFDDGTIRRRPAFIVDAFTFHIYRNWDLIKRVEPVPFEWAEAGGVGGNEKTGPLIHDGEMNHLPLVRLQKNDDGCVLQNENIIVQDVAYPDISSTTKDCEIKYPTSLLWLSPDENETRWKDDEVNGGYSPSIDALYAGSMTAKLFHDWYGISLAAKPIKLGVHYGRNSDNAFWDPISKQAYFGDGSNQYFPFTPIEVVAHEIGHGFTLQHAQLAVESSSEMHALDESFSDILGVTVKQFASGKLEWNIGCDMVKGDHIDLCRFLDDPTKPNSLLDPEEGVYIDHYKNLNLTHENPYFIAGITNKAFYLLATSPNWSTHKAFDVFLKANMDYWNSSMTTLNEAACGVISATRDYGYSVEDVKSVFTKVGLDISAC